LLPINTGLYSSGVFGLGVFTIRLLRLFLFFFAGIVAVDVYSKHNKLLSLLWLLVACSLASQGIILLQILGVLPVLWPTKWLYYEDHWRTGLLSPHHLQPAVYAITSIFFYGLYDKLYFSINKKSLTSFWKIALIVSSFIWVYICFFNESRTGMVLSFFLLAFYIGISPKNIFISIVLSSIVVFSNGWLFSTLVDFFSQGIEEEATRYEVQGSLSSQRVYIRNEIIERFLSFHDIRYYTGYGFNNYPGPGAAAHNNYLQILLEFGLIGLFLVVSYLYKLLKRSFSFIRNDIYLFSGVYVAFMCVAMFFNEIIYPTYIGFATPALVIISFEIARSLMKTYRAPISS